MIADNHPPPIQNRLRCYSFRLSPSLREYANKMDFLYLIARVELIGYHAAILSSLFKFTPGHQVGWTATHDEHGSCLADESTLKYKLQQI
jgi:hypothetical protein